MQESLKINARWNVGDINTSPLSVLYSNCTVQWRRIKKTRVECLKSWEDRYEFPNVGMRVSLQGLVWVTLSYNFGVYQPSYERLRFRSLLRKIWLTAPYIRNENNNTLTSLVFFLVVLVQIGHILRKLGNQLVPED